MNAADAQPAGGHLPVRAVALRGVAEARLDRRAPDHRHRAGAQHHRPHPLPPRESRHEHRLPRPRPRPPCPSRPRQASTPPGLAEKVTIRNLDFFYGDSRALKGISLSLYANKATAFIGPSGCGKSTLLRVLNRMYDLYPGQRATGDVLFDGDNLLRADAGHQPAARAHRHGVPEADAVSRCRSTRTSPSASASTRRLPRAELDAPRRDGAAPRRAVGRGQGQARRQRPRACRAASSSGCASPAPWR